MKPCDESVDQSEAEGSDWEPSLVFTISPSNGFVKNCYKPDVVKRPWVANRYAQFTIYHRHRSSEPSCFLIISAEIFKCTVPIGENVWISHHITVDRSLPGGLYRRGPRCWKRDTEATMTDEHTMFRRAPRPDRGATTAMAIRWWNDCPVVWPFGCVEEEHRKLINIRSCPFLLAYQEI